MSRRALLCVIVAAAGLAGASIVFADTRVVSDPSGDVKHSPPGADARYDIVSISYGHAANGDLLDTVKTKGKVFGVGSPSTPLLWIDVPGKIATRKGCQYSDYFVADGEVQQCGEGPTTGKAQIKKLNSHTLQFEFKASAIKNPAKFGVAFVEEGFSRRGPVFYDRGPNTGFVKHRLR